MKSWSVALFAVVVACGIGAINGDQSRCVKSIVLPYNGELGRQELFQQVLQAVQVKQVAPQSEGYFWFRRQGSFPHPQPVEPDAEAGQFAFTRYFPSSSSVACLPIWNDPIACGSKWGQDIQVRVRADSIEIQSSSLLAGPNAWFWWCSNTNVKNVNEVSELLEQKVVGLGVNRAQGRDEKICRCFNGHIYTVQPPNEGTTPGQYLETFARATFQKMPLSRGCTVDTKGDISCDSSPVTFSQWGINPFNAPEEQMANRDFAFDIIKEPSSGIFPICGNSGATQTYELLEEFRALTGGATGIEYLQVLIGKQGQIRGSGSVDSC